MKKTSIWSVLRAWSTPTKWYWLGDRRPADQRTQSVNFSIVIHQSFYPTAQAPRFLSLHACMNQSSTFRFLAPMIVHAHSSTWVSSHSVTESGSECDVSTRSRGNYYAWSLTISAGYRSMSQASLSPSLLLTKSHSRTIYKALPRLV